MDMDSDATIVTLKELAKAVLEGKSTADILSRIIKVMQTRLGLVSGGFVMQHNEFWSAEAMLGFDFKDLSGVFGKWKTTRVFADELGELISAEVLSDSEMSKRYPDKELACETADGISRIRIPLRYRQNFIGFFIFERKPESPDGKDSRRIASLMEIIGAIVADVAETRTNQKIEHERLVALNRKLKSRLEPLGAEIIGESDGMREVYDLVRQVAPTGATALIRGATGTGKELVARSIVELSNRKGRPFLTVNCAALPETLIESELFGHEKGAFTGAVERRIGRAEAADGGTLFLDEVGDLTPATQVKLLRFLQERTFSRLGSNEERKSDVRFIAATSRNLEDLIEKKLFREDLYYRLNVFTIQVPSLSYRRGDILLLARHFADKFNRKYGRNITRWSPDVTAALIDWKWPGNVRELENCVERAVLTATDDTVRMQNLPPPMRPADWTRAEADASMGDVPPQEGATFDNLVNAYRKAVITAALKKNGGNKSAAARSLGLTPRMMYYELKR